MNVCERWFRFGGARGPPGTVGGLVMLIGLEIFIDDVVVRLDDIESNLPLDETEDKEPDEADVGRLLGLSFFEILVLRPNEAKNPPLFEVAVDGVRERMEGEAPTLVLDRDGGFIAKDGYGRVRDTEVGVISS